MNKFKAKVYKHIPAPVAVGAKFALFTAAAGVLVYLMVYWPDAIFAMIMFSLVSLLVGISYFCFLKPLTKDMLRGWRNKQHQAEAFLRSEERKRVAIEQKKEEDMVSKFNQHVLALQAKYPEDDFSKWIEH